ncbi:hypothetical protein [Morganella morganii]
MDEYSPRNYDIAVLKYLCDELCPERSPHNFPKA